MLSRPGRPEEAALTPTAEQVGQIVGVLGEQVGQIVVALGADDDVDVDLDAVDSCVGIMAVVAQK